jgi:hypothetical protein
MLLRAAQGSSGVSDQGQKLLQLSQAPLPPL